MLLVSVVSIVVLFFSSSVQLSYMIYVVMEEIAYIIVS